MSLVGIRGFSGDAVINAVIAFALPGMCRPAATYYPEGGCQVHSSREDKMPRFPSLQPLPATTVGRTSGALKDAFKGLSAHAGGSASYDSATTLFKT